MLLWLIITLALSVGRSWHRVRGFFVVGQRFVASESTPADWEGTSDGDDSTPVRG